MEVEEVGIQRVYVPKPFCAAAPGLMSDSFLGGAGLVSAKAIAVSLAVAPGSGTILHRM